MLQKLQSIFSLFFVVVVDFFCFLDNQKDSCPRYSNRNLSNKFNLPEKNENTRPITASLEDFSDLCLTEENDSAKGFPVLTGKCMFLVYDFGYT